MPKRSIIKGRCVIAVLCAAVLIIALMLYLPSGNTAGLRAAQAAQQLNEYVFDLRFVPEESKLFLSMTLHYRNYTTEALSSLVLRTYANAYADAQYSPAAIDELYDTCYPEGFSIGSLTLEGVWWNDQLVTASYLDKAQTALSIPIPALAPGQSGQLTLHGVLTIPHCAHRFGYSNGVWQFGNALPILSVYDENGWRQDPYCAIGDPFVSECANYSVTITAPKGWQCAASGAVAQENGVFRIRALAVRDFAFALSKDWHTASASANGVKVLSYAADSAAARRAARFAAQAVKTYSTLYGDYPYETLTLCQADFPLGGMEYPSFILIDDTYYFKDWEDTLELLIAHETAHQWFYGMVGSDQYNAPWQDEALCEWAALRYVKARYGQSAYENLAATRIHAPMQERILSPVTPGSPLDHFGSYADYSAVVYGRGAALMQAIEEMTGQADHFLRAYCDQFAFSLASREDFSHCLNAWSESDLSPLILDYIDTYMN